MTGRVVAWRQRAMRSRAAAGNAPPPPRTAPWDHAAPNALYLVAWCHDELRACKKVFAQELLGLTPEFLEAGTLQLDAVLDLDELDVRREGSAICVWIDALRRLELDEDGWR